MKKMLSTIVAVLVAVSFAGVVFAAEPVQQTAPASQPAVKKQAAQSPATHRMVRKAPKKKRASIPRAQPPAK